MSIDNINKELVVRLEKFYNTNSKLRDFGSRQNFIDWYISQNEEGVYRCHYCKTDIKEIRLLLQNGIIEGRGVKGGAKRGCNLEIDRKDSSKGYLPNNCVLACYYCNNDKSNTIPYDVYLKIFGPFRHQTFNALKKLPPNPGLGYKCP